MRRLILAAAGILGAFLYRTGLHRVWIGLVPGPRVLLLHACEPTESDWTRGLASNTTPEGLRAIARYLAENYPVVSLPELEGGTAPRRCAVITFDDGYRSVFDQAFPILREHGLPATGYLIADTLAGARNCWVNRVNLRAQRAPGLALERVRARWPELRVGSPDALVGAMISAFDPVRVRAFLEEGEGPGGALRFEEPDERLHVVLEEVAEMAASGWTFGNHTRTHPNLARLSDPEVAEELAGARLALEDVPGMTASVAYPFGHHDEGVRAEALRQGATSIMEVGGWNFRWNPARVARIPVYGGNSAELFTEIEIVGFLKGVARALLSR